MKSVDTEIVAGFSTPIQNSPVWLSVANRFAGLLQMHGFRVAPIDGEPVRAFDEVQARVVSLAGTVATALLNRPGAFICDLHLYEHGDVPGCIVLFVELDTGHMWATAIPAIRSTALASRPPMTLQ